jgi:hypothetical protein
MRKIVLTYGVISGAVISALMFFTMPGSMKDVNMESGQWIGYTTMVIALSLVFFAIKSYRDKYQQGVISFGKGFLTGLYITLIAGSMYAFTWEIMYRNMDGDFMEVYKTHMVKEMQKKGTPETEIKAKVAEMDQMAQMYKNPVFRFVFTLFVEFLPVGILISLISALILRKRNPTVETSVNKI